MFLGVSSIVTMTARCEKVLTPEGVMINKHKHSITNVSVFRVVSFKFGMGFFDG